jgi:excisionase family DNA binding protein
MNPTLPIPNPQDWCDINQACELLGRSRATVYDMNDRGVIHIHRIGSSRMLWRAEVLEVATALRRLEVGATARRAT